jgi:hypothetical protein
MADVYVVKINRQEGSVEVAGDKDWVEQKLAEFADVYSGEPTQPAARVKPAKTTRKRQTKPATDGGSPVRRRTGSPTRVKGLDLAPKGKQSFAAFVSEKQPKSQHDQNVLSVYYLLEIAEVAPVTWNHVYTCYRDQGWAVPADMANSLQVTASRKTFLDTADMENITLEPRGTNHVEHHLPAKKK